MKLRPYPEYKDSGVPWLGKIPAHWDVKPGMAFISQRKEKNVGMKESTVLSLSYGQIVVKPPEKLHGLVPESFETYQIADPGNIIIRGTDLQNDKTSLRVGKVRNRGIITSAYLCLQANEKINPDYAHLLLHGYDLMKIYYGMGSGLRQNLDFSDFKRLPFLVPSPTEQNKIHKYVEYVHAQINKFIRNKRRLIELLKEQKQNVINQAVTRGLDPDVKLKPSGVEWIGDIPEHWKMLPLKRLASFKGGTGFPHEAQGRSGLELPFYKVSDMTLSGNETYMINTNNSISRETASSLGATIFPERAIIFPKVGGAMLTNKRRILTKPSCIDNNMMGCVLNSETIFDFLFLRLQTLDLGLIRKPGPVPAIGEGEVRAFRVPYPPEEEQLEIVEYVKVQTSAIDQAISRAQREIELMREYRTRLISDVVTGQVDVRGIEVPEVAEDELLALEEDTGETDDVIDDEGDMDETD